MDILVGMSGGVDSMGVELVNRFMSKLEKIETYRDAIPTQSILTIKTV